MWKREDPERSLPGKKLLCESSILQKKRIVARVLSMLTDGQPPGKPLWIRPSILIEAGSR